MGTLRARVEETEGLLAKAREQAEAGAAAAESEQSIREQLQAAHKALMAMEVRVGEWGARAVMSASQRSNLE